jgi:hypothetical protein
LETLAITLTDIHISGRIDIVSFSTFMIQELQSLCILRKQQTHFLFSLKEEKSKKIINME